MKILGVFVMSMPAFAWIGLWAGGAFSGIGAVEAILLATGLGLFGLLCGAIGGRLMMEG